MLNDAIIPGRDQTGSAGDRRRAGRRAVGADLVVRWHHDPGTAIRYPLLDIGDGGARIGSATPLPEGMSGTAVKLLPGGEAVNRPCRVIWARPPALEDSFEIGLAFG